MTDLIILPLGSGEKSSMSFSQNYVYYVTVRVKFVLIEL